MIVQLRRTHQDLQQALSEREALRGQLLQAERAVSSRSPQLRACLHSLDATLQGSKLKAKVFTMAPLPRQAPNCNFGLPRSERLLKVLCTYYATYTLADSWGRR